MATVSRADATSIKLLTSGLCFTEEARYPVQLLRTERIRSDQLTKCQRLTTVEVPSNVCWTAAHSMPRLTLLQTLVFTLRLANVQTSGRPRSRGLSIS